MKKILLSLSILLISSMSHALNSSVAIVPTSAIIVSSAPALANQAAVITISSPTSAGAYSTGYYNYLQDLHIVAYATGTVAGIAIPNTCTITGMPTNPTLTVETTMAIGTSHVRDFSYAAPIQANQNAQVVITCPATGGVLWNIWATYFVGP